MLQDRSRASARLMSRVTDALLERRIPVTANDDVVRLVAPSLDYTARQREKSVLLLGLCRLSLVHVADQQRDLRVRIQHSEEMHSPPAVWCNQIYGSQLLGDI